MKKELLLSAAMLGLITGAMHLDSAQASKAKEEGKYKCMGGNACKGKGKCGSAEAGAACEGKNECKGKGFIYTHDEAECHKLTKAKK